MHHPLTQEACYIVNAPWAFTAIFSFIRPFLAQTTLDKIKVLGYAALCGPHQLLHESVMCSTGKPFIRPKPLASERLDSKCSANERKQPLERWLSCGLSVSY